MNKESQPKQLVIVDKVAQCWLTHLIFIYTSTHLKHIYEVFIFYKLQPFCSLLTIEVTIYSNINNFQVP